MRDLLEIVSMLCLFALGTGLVVLVGMGLLRWLNDTTGAREADRISPAAGRDLARAGVVVGPPRTYWLDSEPFFGPHPHGWPHRAWFYDQEVDGAYQEVSDAYRGALRH